MIKEGFYWKIVIMLHLNNLFKTNIIFRILKSYNKFDENIVNAYHFEQK